jgi:hypothetical protein
MKISPAQPLIVSFTILINGLLCFPSLAQAQIPRGEPITRPARTPTLKPVGSTTALEEGASVQLFPGRASVINFRTNEFITSVTLSDPTYVLYAPNAEIESGQATVLILRLSNGISFENLSRSSKPNISITTTNDQDEQTTYLFDLEIASGLPVANRDQNGIAIVPDNEVISSSGDVIQTAKGEATMNHIQRGLRIAIHQGLTSRTDPVVAQVQEVLAQSRNGGSLRAIAQQVGVPLSVLSALGEMGLDAAQRSRL